MSLIKQSTATRLQIEYGQPVPDLFSKVAHACIAEDKSLAILAEVELRSRRISEILFSVLDWRFQSPTLRTFDARRPNKKRFRSTRKTEPLVTSCSSFDTLAVRGFLIALYPRILRMKTTLNLRDNAIKNRNLDAFRWMHQDWDGIYRGAALHLDLPVSIVRSAEQRDILMLSKPSKASYEPLGHDQMLHLSLRRTVTREVSSRLEVGFPLPVLLITRPLVLLGSNDASTNRRRHGSYGSMMKLWGVRCTTGVPSLLQVMMTHT